MELTVRSEPCAQSGVVHMWRYVQFQRRFDLRSSEYWRGVLLAGCMPLLAVALLVIAVNVYRSRRPRKEPPGTAVTVAQMRWVALLVTSLIFLALCCELLLHYNILRSFPKTTFAEDDKLTLFRSGIVQKIKEATKHIKPHSLHPVDELEAKNGKYQNPNSIEDLYSLYRRLTLQIFAAAGTVDEQFLEPRTPRYSVLKQKMVLYEWVRYLVMTSVWSAALGLAAVTARGGGATDAACGACGLVFCGVMAAALTSLAAALSSACEDSARLDHLQKQKPRDEVNTHYTTSQLGNYCNYWRFEFLRRLAEFRWRIREANRKWVTQAFIDGLLIRTNTFETNDTWPESVFPDGYYGRREYTIEIYENVLKDELEHIDWLQPPVDCKLVKPRVIQDTRYFCECERFLKWLLLQLALIVLAIVPFLILMNRRPRGRRPPWNVSNISLKRTCILWPRARWRKLWSSYKDSRQQKKMKEQGLCATDQSSLPDSRASAEVPYRMRHTNVEQPSIHCKLPVPPCKPSAPPCRLPVPLCKPPIPPCYPPVPTCQPPVPVCLPPTPTCCRSAPIDEPAQSTCCTSPAIHPPAQSTCCTSPAIHAPAQSTCCTSAAIHPPAQSTCCTSSAIHPPAVPICCTRPPACQPVPSCQQDHEPDDEEDEEENEEEAEEEAVEDPICEKEIPVCKIPAPIRRKKTKPKKCQQVTIRIQIPKRPGNKAPPSKCSRSKARVPQCQRKKAVNTKPFRQKHNLIRRQGPWYLLHKATSPGCLQQSDDSFTETDSSNNPAYLSKHYQGVSDTISSSSLRDSASDEEFI